MTTSKISFCTACHGEMYLGYLKDTLPKSIENTMGSNVEFVILAYGDRNVEKWVIDTYPDQINDDRIRIGYLESASFRISHAKNVAHKIASGNILCNVDTDNHVTHEFLHLLQREFSLDGNIFAKYIWKPDPNEPQYYDQKPGMQRRGIAGRLALTRDAFFKVRGYRESFGGWGFDDTDLADRLREIGVRQVDIPEEYMGETIRHSDESRAVNLSPDEREESIRRLQNTDSTYVRDYAPANPQGFGYADVYINGSSTSISMRDMFSR